MSSGALQRAVTVAVVDDDWGYRWAVRLLATAHPDRISLVVEAETVAELLSATQHADVVLLDVYLGDDDELSVEHIPEIMAQGSTVLLHTKERAPAPLLRALELGACGLVLKKEGPETLLPAVLAAARGEESISSPIAHALLFDSRCARLTRREKEVIELIADGLEQGEVAEALTVTTGAVKQHMKNITDKYRDLQRPSGGKRTVRSAIADGHVRPRGLVAEQVEGDEETP